MLCQRDICQQIIEEHGDYLFTVKGNQLEPTLLAFPPGTETLRKKQLDCYTGSKFHYGHDRTSIDTYKASSRLAGD